MLPMGLNFVEHVKPLDAMVQGRFTIQGVIKVRVASVESVLAPSYQFYGHEVTQATQTEAAMKADGVQPL